MQRNASTTCNKHASPEKILTWLDSVGDVSAMLVLPSTRAIIEAVLRRSNRDTTIVVADPAVIPGALDPARYLAVCQQSEMRGEWAPNAYVFTDQFGDAPVAMLLVQLQGRQEFMTVTEAIARAIYTVDVHVWTDVGCLGVRSIPAKDFTPVLRALADYYRSCDGLGEEWLMRGRQRRRQPEERLNNAARRLRLYESLIMQAFANNELDDQTRVLLRALGARRGAVMGRTGVRQ